MKYKSKQGKKQDNAAVDLVVSLPEIREFAHRVQNRFVLLSETVPDDRILVQAAEDMGDHLATFGWYKVDAKSQAIKRRL